MWDRIGRISYMRARGRLDVEPNWSNKLYESERLDVEPNWSNKLYESESSSLKPK